MAQLLVTVSDDMHKALKRRAATRGRSIEKERGVLVRARLGRHTLKRTFKEALASMPHHRGDDVLSICGTTLYGLPFKMQLTVLPLNEHPRRLLIVRQFQTRNAGTAQRTEVASPRQRDVMNIKDG